MLKLLKLGILLSLSIVILQGFSQSTSTINSNQESVSSKKSSNTSTNSNQQILKIKGNFDPKSFSHLPKEFQKNTGKKLGLDENQLTNKNTFVNLTVKLKNDSDLIDVSGAVKPNGKAFGIKGDGWRKTVEVEGKTYYYISFNADFQGVNFSGKEKEAIEKRETNGGGLLFVDASNPNNFRGSLTIGIEGGTSVLHFGDGNEVYKKINKKLQEMK